MKQQQQQQINNGEWRVAESSQQQQEQHEFYSVDISDAYNIAELNEERLALFEHIS